MAMTEDKDQQLIASALLNRILNSRIKITRNDASTIERGDFIDYPVFIVLEEGHRFAPNSGESYSKSILKTVLSEGRKFGMGVCLISQRPGKLDPDVLSQCMTQIIMKTINPADQKNIKDSLESVSEDLIELLPSLNNGVAIVAGAAVNTPVMVNIRKRFITHGGQSEDMIQKWEEKYSANNSTDSYDDINDINVKELDENEMDEDLYVEDDNEEEE